MRRLLTIIGTLFIVVGCTVLIVFVILPAAISSLDAVPIMKNTFQGLFCKSDEILVASHSTYRSLGHIETALEIDCVNDNDQKRDISSIPIVVGLVGFVTLFFLGLLMVIGASGINKLAYATE